MLPKRLMIAIPMGIYCIFLPLYRDHDFISVQKRLVQSHTDEIKPTMLNREIKGRLTISPGELPTYTGWSRPNTTIAPFLTLTSKPPTTVKAQEIYTVSIHCPQQFVQCLGNHNNFFYSRAYGPSILTGKTRKNGHIYEIDFFFIDEGKYTVEIVLTFSNVHEFQEYPLKMQEEERAYEGWLLSGFPMQITVLPVDKQGNEKKLCQEDQLISNAYEYMNDPFQARWVVIDKVNLFHSMTLPPKKDSIDSEHFLQGYEPGDTTLGIKLDYHPKGCELLPDSFSDLISHSNSEQTFNSSSCFAETKGDIHLIFIGDSVMLHQKQYFENIILPQIPEKIKITKIETHNGLVKRLPEIQSKLTEIKSLETKNYVFFNAGLHDVAQLCSRRYDKARREYLDESDDKLRCGNLYKDHFVKLLDMLHEFPAEKKIFRTTSAGWLKYGNFGFGWPSTNQMFTLSADFVTYFNEIAIQTLQESDYPEFTILDGYWVSLARPDNTEITKENSIGPHLVHPGKEVFSAMTRMLWTVVLNDVCPLLFLD